MNPRVVQPNDPPHLKAMFSILGLSEIAGPQHERRVLAMYAACGHPEINNDETPWCAAGVGWCLVQSSLPLPPTARNLMARSYAKYGRELDTDDILPRGAILVWPRGRPPSGHVNLLLHDDGTTLTCIGCNQGNGKGGGVTITREAKSNLIAARMPVGIVKPAPKPVPAPPPPDVDPPEHDVPVPAPRPQPDDPGVDPTPAHVPFWKKPFVWLGGLLSGGMMGGASVSLDAQFLLGLTLFLVVAFGLFLTWVYAIPPRGKFIKGIF